MADVESQFFNVLQEADEEFQAKKFPKLKITLRGASTNISNLIDILIRKSLVKQDAYNYEEEKDAFSLPEEKAFLEGERGRIMFDRLKATSNALEFMANSMPENLDGFTEEYINNLVKIISYFAFNNFSGANNINTRTLKELVDKIIGGNDEIFKKVMQDNLKLLVDTYNSLQNFLEDITKFKKEEYKTLIRFEVFPHLPPNINEKLFDENQMEYTNRLEEWMKVNNSDIVFNKLWIGEAIKDCYATDDQAAFEKLVSYYKLDPESHRGEGKAASPREKLIKIILNLANTKKNIEDIYYDFDHNLKLVKNREKSFLEKLQDMLMKIMNISNQEDFFHVEYINPATKTVQKDIININDFILAIKKKILLFTELTKSTSTVYAKIHRGTEDALYKFLEDSYIELLLMKERIIGLDAEIRLITNKAIKKRFRNLVNPVKDFDGALSKIGEQRRRFIIEQENFSKQKKP